jgi:putative DNA primase/helicase
MNKWQELRLQAALEYAAKGWRVLPVGASKKPINHNGSTGATTEPKQILQWWTANPFANIGVATGPESFWVVDIDMKDGVNGIESLNAEYGDASFDTASYLCATTATGGMHLLFQWPRQGGIRNAQGILAGVDLRGVGGYIVVSPSARKIGENYIQYKWNNGGLPISPAPEWAQNLARRQHSKAAQGVDLTRVMTGLTAGERDNELLRYACHLSSRGVPLELARAFIGEAAHRCMPPFNQADAVDKVDWAYKRQRPAPSESRAEMLGRVVRESKSVK